MKLLFQVSFCTIRHGHFRRFRVPNVITLHLVSSLFQDPPEEGEEEGEEEEVCGDTPNFVDAHGYSCREYVEYDCLDQALFTKYSRKAWQAVIDNCRVSCSLSLEKWLHHVVKCPVRCGQCTGTDERAGGVIILVFVSCVLSLGWM